MLKKIKDLKGMFTCNNLVRFSYQNDNFINDLLNDVNHQGKLYINYHSSYR